MLRPEALEISPSYVAFQFPADAFSSMHTFYRAAQDVGYNLRLENEEVEPGKVFTRVLTPSEDDAKNLNQLEGNFRQSPVGIMSLCVGTGDYYLLMDKSGDFLNGRISMFLSFIPDGLRLRAFLKAYERDIEFNGKYSIDFPNKDKIFKRAKFRYDFFTSQGAEGISEDELRIIAAKGLANVLNLTRQNPFKEYKFH